MSIASSVTARLMETWAHGQDVADALGVTREPTARLRHIAHLGVRTLGFSFRLRGAEAPAIPVRVELVAPDGSTWDWGPADAADRVTGPALDLCLVVTQRRHVGDTALRVEGPVAADWMAIAQAFAGTPGPGRVRTTSADTAAPAGSPAGRPGRRRWPARPGRRPPVPALATPPEPEAAAGSGRSDGGSARGHHPR
jgi:hypothetical protein